MIAFCWRSGRIEFGHQVPRGAIEVLRGKSAFVRDRICACARHARTSDALLVPGIPEAADDLEAEAALVRFIDFAGRKPVREAA